MLARRLAGREAGLLARGVASWSKFDPQALSGSNPAQLSNLGEPLRREQSRRPRNATLCRGARCRAAGNTEPMPMPLPCRNRPRPRPRRRRPAAVFGEWVRSERDLVVPDPLNGQPFISVPDTQLYEVEPFVTSLRACPRTGLHNPLKNPDRCGKWGKKRGGRSVAQ